MREWKKLPWLLFIGGAALLAALVSPAVAGKEPHPEAATEEALATDHYVGEDVMIPMRDGVKLHAQVWRPKEMSEPLPILMVRWPYGFPVEATKSQLSEGGKYADLAKDKFIFVFQDIRGRFASEGEYVTLRPSRTSPDGIDEYTDTYDTIAWLVKEVPDNNGKVGIFGVSYGDWTTAVATIDPHSAPSSAPAQAPPDDQWFGDDFHHNGAFRLDYAWSWLSLMETDGRTLNRFDFDGETAYDWYLKQTDIGTLDQQHLGISMPYWQQFVQHPDYDEFWKMSRTSNMMPKKPTVPNLIIAGWWDQEDFYGPLTIYARQKPYDDEGRNYLVIGLWSHGGWWFEGSTYGPYKLGAKTGDWYRANVELPWFRFWLKGEGELNQPGALIFQTGSNKWQQFDGWPLKKNVTARNLYFHSGGVFSFDEPKKPAETKTPRLSFPIPPILCRIAIARQCR